MLIRLIRGIGVPLLAIGLVVLLVWSLQSGRFPGLGGGDAGDVGGGDDDFFSVSGEPLGAERGDGPGLGKSAPEFLLRDTNGSPVRLGDFRGKVVLLNFWATWCAPCRREFPELVRLYAGGAGDVVVVAINMQENAGEVMKFADEFGAEFPILIDPRAEAAEAYRLLGLPSSYFIDQQGILREQHFGVLTDDIIRKKVAEARAAGAAR